MEQKSRSKLGAVLGGIAIVIGVATLGAWFAFDAQSLITATASLATIFIGSLAVFMHIWFGTPTGNN